MTYKIENHKLVGIDEYHVTRKKGKPMVPKLLLIHYTAGATFDADVKTLSVADVQASCHLVLGKDGRIAQIGLLNDTLWHAGKSQWKGRTGLNSYAIGIEVCCEGPVEYVRTEDGVKIYKTWFGKELRGDKVTIVNAAHKNGGGKKDWVAFTDKQIEVLKDLGKSLMDHYDLEEAVGHDMVAPTRKQDPGPCMPDSVYDFLNNKE